MKTSSRVIERQNDIYPRPLREKERDLLEFVLPAESPGYAEYRRHIAGMVVLAEGRRGKGNLVLGEWGDDADTSSPLAAVIAYGAVETTQDTYTITVRERVDDQVDVEIVSSHGGEIPDHFEEKRRWTYSTWKPGMRSPATDTPVREVKITATLVLAVARHDRRIWLHDAATGMNHLIPITTFYNELMRRKGIRDPRVALNADLFFTELEKYTDAEVHDAFVAYNRVRKKVDLVPEEPPPAQRGWKALFRKVFKR